MAPELLVPLLVHLLLLLLLENVAIIAQVLHLEVGRFEVITQLLHLHRMTRVWLKE